MTRILHKLFAWKIYNFYMCPKGFRLNSPNFTVEESKKAKFTLSVMPRLRDDDGEIRHLKIFISRIMDREPIEVTIRFEISLYDAFSDRQIHTRTFTSRFFGSKQISKDVFVQNIHSHLLIMCKISPADKVNQDFEDYERLSTDLRDLLESGMDSDITIVAENKEFKVHEFILECRCPKLSQNLLETEQLHVFSLPDTPADVLKAILYYVYTGKFDGSEMIFESVFSSGKTYDFEYITSHEEITRVIGTLDISSVLYKFYLKVDPLKISKEYFCSVTCDPLDIVKRLNVSVHEKLIGDHICSICCKFKLLKKGKFNIFMRCYLSVENSNGDNHPLKKFHHIFEDEEAWEVAVDIETLEVKKILKNDKNISLHVKMDMSIYGGYSHDTEHTINNFKYYPEHKMWKYYRNNLREAVNRNGDFTFYAENVFLSAHKAILHCRLENTLLNDLYLTSGNYIKIEEVPAHIMKCMLYYIYTGGINDSWDLSKAVWLYVASTKLGMTVLQNRCRHFMKSQISEESISDVKLLSIHHNDEVLKQCVSDFTCENSDIYWLDKHLKILKCSKFYSEIWNRIRQSLI